MIALKALLLGIGFSVLGTIAYVVFLIWYALRGTPLFNSGVGFDITSLAHNTYLAPERQEKRISSPARWCAFLAKIIQAIKKKLVGRMVAL
jgi:hypothetical protein